MKPATDPELLAEISRLTDGFWKRKWKNFRQGFIEGLEVSFFIRSPRLREIVLDLLIAGLLHSVG